MTEEERNRAETMLAMSRKATEACRAYQRCEPQSEEGKILHTEALRRLQEVIQLGETFLPKS